MIKVGYLVSYDFFYLPVSLEQVYPYVDKIILAIDLKYLTWSGNRFEIPQSFFEEINILDVDKKIQFYWDDFYVPELSPMQCEIRERNMLLKVMGSGWKIQLDVDEYLYDFVQVKKYLDQLWYLNVFPTLTPIAFSGKLVTLYKETPEGFLYIDNDERFPFITNHSKYIGARRNFEIKNFHANIRVIHQSWARNHDEMITKFNNWGHRDDFDKDETIMKWSKVNKYNYNEYINFHPIVPHVWDKLRFIECYSINDFILKFSNDQPQELLRLTKKMKIKIFKELVKVIIRWKK